MDTIVNTDNGTDTSKVCGTCMMYEYTKAVLTELLENPKNKSVKEAIGEEEKHIHHPSDINDIPDHFETKLLTDESCPMCLMNHYTKDVLERLLK